MAKLDTQVPTEGAECLVQGMLCRAAIPTFKAPAFRAAYDLIAVNPKTKISTTIQVKSRFQTDCDRGFIVNRLGADFFAFVFLNMGNWYAGRPDDGICSPEFYIIPKAEVERAVDRTKKVRKYFIRHNDKSFEKYREAWHSVAEYLAIEIDAVLRGDAGIP